MMEFDFILASGAVHLKEKLESHGYRVCTSDTNHDGKRFFPNTDLYVRLSEVSQFSDRRVVVVQNCTGSSPQEEEQFTTADRIQELMLLLNILRQPVNVEKTGHKKYEYADIKPPSKVEVVLTMQPYALQDKAFKTGETAAAYHAIKAISGVCDRLWLVAPVVTTDTKWAAEMVKCGLYYEIPITKQIVGFGAGTFGFDDFILVGPDEGAQSRFGVPGLQKQRADSFTIELSGELDVKGKNVIVIDDLTKSGSTLLKSRDILIEQGAKDVGLVVLHVTPVSENGEELFDSLVQKSLRKVVTSNTVFTSTFCEKYPHLAYDIVDLLIKHLQE
ncbi:MAG: phosphoribosyltransferase family protein [Candidatus Thorarchaeota archaeon]